MTRARTGSDQRVAAGGHRRKLGAGAGVSVVLLAWLTLMMSQWRLPSAVRDDATWGSVFALTASAVLCWMLVAGRVMRLRENLSRERHRLLYEAAALELASVRTSEAPARLRSALDWARDDGLGPGTVDTVNVPAGPRSLLTVEDWWSIAQARSRAASPEQRDLDHHVRDALRCRFVLPDGSNTGAWRPRVPDSASSPVRAILAAGLLPITLAALLCTLLWVVGASAVAVQRAGLVVYVMTLILIPLVLAAREMVTGDPVTRLRDEVGRGRAALQDFCVSLGQASSAAAEHVGDPLRAVLADSAAELERASSCLEPRGLLAILQAWEARLDAFMVATKATGPRSMCAEVTSRCAPWSGLCRITTSFDSGLAAVKGPLAIAAGRIVEEAISNACRHGHADEVSVTVVSDDEDGITVCVDDNGSGPLNGDLGIGRTMFAEISRGRVSLTRREDGGARLTVIVPWDFAAV